MSLILHWTMEDDTSGIVEDPTGGCPLTTYGLPPFIDGPAALGGLARAFNSLPTWQTGLPVQYATNRSAPAGVRAALVGANYTFACWVRPQNGAASTAQRIVVFEHSAAPDTFGGLYLMSYTTLQWIAAGWNTSFGAPAQAWTFDAWNHVVVRKRGGLIDLWINGVERYADEAFEPDFAGYPAGCGAFLATDSDVVEGVETGIGSRFSGGLDDVRLYDVALSDAQVATLYAGGDPFAPVASGDAPDPAADLAAHLAGLSPVGDVTLEVGGNLFAGPERAVRAEVPELALFAQNTTGAAPVPYVNDRFDFARFAVSLLVRSNPGQFAAGEQLAREVLRALHREKPTGYVTCLASQAGPTYLGEDEARRHRWSLNFEMWWKG